MEEGIPRSFRRRVPFQLAELPVEKVVGQVDRTKRQIGDESRSASADAHGRDRTRMRRNDYSTIRSTPVMPIPSPRAFSS